MSLDVSDLCDGMRSYLYSSDLVLKIKEPKNDSLNWGEIVESLSVCTGKNFLGRKIEELEGI